jgi:YjbE family integral membrane protein
MSADFFSDLNWVAILKIIGIDLILSGDNAMVIAMACRSLPARQRKWGVLLGAGAAVALRIVLTMFVTQVMQLPWLKLIGGLLLFWVALKLLVEDEDGHEIKDSNSLWKAVWTIVVADAVMSLDNVLAVAAAAEGHFGLIIFGLILSIPLVVAGSQAVMWLMDRFPIVIWAGAALLGSLAGGMLVEDPVLQPWLGGVPDLHVWGQAVGAVLVVALGWIWLRLRSDDDASTSGPIGG